MDIFHVDLKIAFFLYFHRKETKKGPGRHIEKRWRHVVTRHFHLSSCNVLFNKKFSDNLNLAEDKHLSIVINLQLAF